MPPLSPDAFDSPEFVPSPPPMRSDAQRALVAAAREAERALEHLQRRALEIGAERFAIDVGWTVASLAGARSHLERESAG